MSRGDLRIHQLRINRERGRVAWMDGNYYCLHAIFVEKIDGIQKKLVSLGMDMIRINRQIWQSWRFRRHLHLPIVTKLRNSDERKVTGGNSIYRKSLWLFSQNLSNLSKCFFYVFGFATCSYESFLVWRRYENLLIYLGRAPVRKKRKR
jgi:hypothetical protein